MSHNPRYSSEETTPENTCIKETYKATYEFGQPMKRGFEGPDSNGNADLLVRPWSLLRFLINDLVFTW